MSAIDLKHADKRLALATGRLMGAYVASAKAMALSKRQQLFEEIYTKVWEAVGQKVKDYCSAFDIPTKNAKEVNRAALIFAMRTFGRKFEFEIMEESENLVVGRTRKCPLSTWANDMGVMDAKCDRVHQMWGDTLTRALNPETKFTLTRTMTAGYPYCEWVVEIKNYM